MWYLHCVLEHCTFVIYACALSELLISRFSAILKSFCMNNARIGARYNETLLIKLHTDASNMALANQCANFASVRKETVLNKNRLFPIPSLKMPSGMICSSLLAILLGGEGQLIKKFSSTFVQF